MLAIFSLKLSIFNKSSIDNFNIFSIESCFAFINFFIFPSFKLVTSNSLKNPTIFFNNTFGSYSKSFNIKSVFVSFNVYFDFGIFGKIGSSACVNTSKIFGITPPDLFNFIVVPNPILLSNTYFALKHVAN